MSPPTKVFKNGSYLFRENDNSKDLYILHSGKVRISRKDGPKEVSLCELGKGAAFTVWLKEKAG